MPNMWACDILCATRDNQACEYRAPGSEAAALDGSPVDIDLSGDMHRRN